jgi:2Fe-2S ferredoxin
MAQIQFVNEAGISQSIDIKAGLTLMSGAVAGGIQGILGQCGGACSCATCHCYIADEDLSSLPAPDDAEREMLQFVASERKVSSRLACKIDITEDMVALRVILPPTQI